MSAQRCDGMVALVTGSSRGLGRAIATRLAERGATVALTARTMDPDPKYQGSLSQTRDEIVAAGGKAVAVQADLSQSEDRERLFAEVVSAVGAPDILVNNAAVSYFTRVEDFTARRYALMFAVQVEAPFQLASLVLPGMRQRGAGWILNISSVAARHPSMPPSGWAGRGSTVYGMCKAALERLSTGLAAEVYADNIAVNALSPTRVVPTPGTIFHHLTTEDDPQSEPPAVMAEAALMLCHRDPRGLTGLITYSQELLTELAIPIPSGGRAGTAG